MARTVLSDDLVNAFKGVTVVALDIEGVDLGRKGQISLVQLAASPESCFLLDLLHITEETQPLVDWLRTILESEDVVKICHDCRMDSDALRHILGIELKNVHDTSCWHAKITGCDDVNLNNVLLANNIKPNVQRDSSVYAKNHAFWATRPLTPTMIEWALGDVRSIFELRVVQMRKSTSAGAEEAKVLSDIYIDFARSCLVDTVHVNNVGWFIGPRGSSIRQLQKSSKTLVYPRGKRGDDLFLVYFRTPEALAAVVARA